MSSFLSVFIVALLVWRVSGFIAAYRRARLRKVDEEAEREQRKDWARRMQGRSERDK